MNKASVSKKALSVFLSVLMALSCCVTATPWLADTFGLKASFTADAALTGATSIANLKTVVDFAVAKGELSGIVYPGHTQVDNSFYKTITDTTTHGVLFLMAKYAVDYANTILKMDVREDCSNPNRVVLKILSDIGRTGNSEVKNALDAILYQPYGNPTYGSTSTNEPSQIDRIYTVVIRSVDQISCSVEYDSDFNGFGSYEELLAVTDSDMTQISFSADTHRSNYETGSGCDKKTYYGYAYNSYYETEPDLEGNRSQLVDDFLSSELETHISLLKDFATYFSSTLINSDPYSKFGTSTSAALEEVSSNEAAWQAMYPSEPADDFARPSDAVINYYGDQIKQNYITSVGQYMASVKDAANYLQFRSYVTWLNANILSIDTSTLDLTAANLALWDKYDVIELYETGSNYYNTIEDAFGSVATTGYQKLQESDGYQPVATKQVLELLKKFYDYYNLLELKALTDPLYDAYYNTASGSYEKSYTELSTEEFAAVYSAVVGLADDLEGSVYADDAKTAVYPTGYQYIIDFANALKAEMETDQRQAEMEYTFNYAAYFNPKFILDLTKMTTHELETRINEDTAKYNEFVTEWNSIRNNANVSQTVKDLFTQYDALIREYLARLYTQLYKNVETQVLLVMNYTNGGDADYITIENFSFIKAAIEKIKGSIMLDGETTVYDYLNNNDTYKYLVQGNVTLDNGTTMTFKDAYEKALNLVADYEAFLATVTPGSFSPHSPYYNSNGEFVDAARYPSTLDLGRGNEPTNDFVAHTYHSNDVYRVMRTNLDNSGDPKGLVQQLDSFLSSKDFVAILSTLVDGSNSMLTNIPLSDYIMKLVAEFLFKDDILNTLMGALYPAICTMLEDLRRNYVGETFDIDTGVPVLGTIQLKINSMWEVFQLANGLHLAIYPFQLYNSLTSDQISEFSDVANKLRRKNTWEESFNASGEFKANWGFNDIKLENYVEEDGSYDYESWFIARANRFKDALSLLLNGAKPLLVTLFSGQMFNIGNVGDKDHAIANVTASKGIISISTGGFLENASIELYNDNGNIFNGYKSLLVPLFQDIGITEANGLHNSAWVDASNGANLDEVSEIVSAIIDPIVSYVVDTIAKKPVESILNIIPNLVYGITFNRIQSMLSNMKLTINGELHVDKKLLGISLSGLKLYNLNKIGMLNPFELASVLDIKALIKNFDITDINSILGYLLPTLAPDFDGVSMPIVDVYTVLKKCSDLSTTTYLTGGTRYNFVADKADMLWDLLRWVIGAIGDEQFINTILNMAMGEGKDEGTVAKIINNIINNIRNGGPGVIIAALVEVFQPKRNSTSTLSSIYNNMTYRVADYTWWTGRYTGDEDPVPSTRIPASAYLYLSYGNDWTYAKARTFVDKADDIMTNLLKKQLTEDNLNTFGEWVQSLIDFAFSSNALNTVIGLLSKIGGAIDSDLLTYIIWRFTEQGMNLDQWYDFFGYMYNDKAEEPEEGQQAEKTIIEMLDEAAALDPDEEAAERAAAFAAVQTKLNAEKAEADALINSKKNFDGTATYPADFVLRGFTYTLNTDRTPEDVLTNQKNYYNWSYGGYTLNDANIGNREAFQNMLGAVLTGMMPAVDIFLSGADGKLFPQENNTALLTIVGSNGYDSAIIPLFETLGVEDLMDADFFNEIARNVGGQSVNAGGKILSQEQFNGLGTAQKKVDYLFELGFGFVEKLTEGIDEGNYNEFLKNVLATVLPNLLYALQSNALSVIVRNLLQPVLTLLDAVRPIFDVSDFLYELLTDLIDTNLLQGIGKGLERDAEGNLVEPNYFGLNLKKLDFGAIFDIVYRLFPELNTAPLQLGIEAICSVDAVQVNSASTINNGKRYKFVDNNPGGDSEFTYGDIVANRNKNDPANVATILISLVLDLVLADSNVEGKTNADVVVDIIKLFAGDDEPDPEADPSTLDKILELIPNIVDALRNLKDAEAWSVAPNWTYFDDIDGTETPRRTTAEILSAIDQRTAGTLSQVTPVRTIYYIRYAESFTGFEAYDTTANKNGTENLWTEDLAKAMDTGIAQLVDYIISAFVEKDENATLGTFVQKKLDEGALFSMATIRSLAKLLRENVGSMLADFSDLLNVFLGFDVSYWDKAKYQEIPELNKNDFETEDDYNAAVDAQTAADKLTMADFGTELVELLQPLDGAVGGNGGLLTWLLAGHDMAFFHKYQTSTGYDYVLTKNDGTYDYSTYGNPQDLLVIPGGNGYYSVIVPLFEALNFKLPTYDDNGTEKFKYVEDETTGMIRNATTGEYATGIEILSDTISGILSQVQDIMAGNDPMGAAMGTNLIDSVLNRLSNIFYFLNANGLVTMVLNLLSPLAPLANTLQPLVASKLQVPEQAEGETDAEYEQRKFIALVDDLVKSLITEEVENPETGEKEKVSKLPAAFTIANLDLEHIFEWLLKPLLGLDINAAVTSTFYDAQGTVLAENYNYLRNFYLGDIYSYASANGSTAFRMQFTEDDARYDLITVLLYTVMDVLNSAYPEDGVNHAFFVDILGGVKDTDDAETAAAKRAEGAEKLQNLYNMLHMIVSGYEGYDWAYFDSIARENYYKNLNGTMTDEDYKAYLATLTAFITAAAGDGYVVNKADTTMEYLLHTYLNYQNDNFWNEEKALAVQEGFSELVNTIVESIANKDKEEGADPVTTAEYLNGLIGGLVKTNSLIYTVGSLLGNLMQDIPSNVKDLLAAAIPDFDPTAWDEYAGKAVETDKYPAGSISTDNDGNVTTYVEKVEYETNEEFVDAFIDILEPFGYLLDWLLVGEKHSIDLFFVTGGNNNEAAISIGGANGFKNGLVPLLEALGMTFTASDVNDPSLTGIGCIELTLNALLDWVDGIINYKDPETNKADPVGKLVSYLPNIIYFINANGLTVTVLNTLRSLTNVLEQAAGLLKDDNSSDITNLNSLLNLNEKGIDLYDLSLEGICNIVKGLTAGDGYEGLDIIKGVSPVIGMDENNQPIYGDSYLKQWAIGKVVKYDSAAEDAENGRVYYKMQFTGTDPMEKIDILTILLCSVFDVFRCEENEGALKALLSKLDLGDMDLYEVIKSILNMTMAEIEYAPYDWFYFDDEITDDETFNTKDAADGTADHQVPVLYDNSTFGYLAYIGKFKGASNNIWNETTAKNVKDGLYDVLDSLISNFEIEIGGVKKKFSSVDELISTAWGGLNLYSWENIYKIGSLVGGLLKDVDATVTTVLNVLLGIDLSSFKGYVNKEITTDQSLDGVKFNKVKDEETGEESNVIAENGKYTYVYKASLTMSREAFVNEIVSLIEPAGFLLDWLLAGKSIKVLYQKELDDNGNVQPQIELTGAYGFDVAIIPLMEALGCDMSGYAALVESRNEAGEPVYVASAENEPTIGVKLLKLAANALLGRIEAIASTENDHSPLAEIVAMLPELIYFINANGLSVSVMNLLVPAVGLVDAVGALLPSSGNGTEPTEPTDPDDPGADPDDPGTDPADPTGDGEELTSYERVVNSLNGIINGLDAVKNIEGLTIDLGDLTMVGILDMVGGALGLQINEALTKDWVDIAQGVQTPVVYKNIFATLALGIVEQFTSANGNTAYRMLADTTNWTAELIEAHDGRTIGGIDMFAVLLSAVLDVFRWEGNRDVLEKTLKDLTGKDGLYDLILGILKLDVDFTYNAYDWFYFDDDSGNEITDKATFDSHATDNKVTVTYGPNTTGYFAYKYGYLEYFRYWNGTETSNNIWTKDFANGLAAKFYDLADLIIEAVTAKEENEADRYTSMSKFIADKWNGLNLYTTENLYKIGSMIGGAVAGIKGVAGDALKLLLDIDLTAWDEYVNNKIADDEHPAGTKIYDEDNNEIGEYVANETLTYTAFVDELVDMLEPAGILLDWLLANRSIDVLYQHNGQAQISLPGADGYGEALVPLLEALGCTPNKNHFGSGEGQVAYTGVNILKYVAELLLGRIDEIANSKDDANKPNCLNVIVSMIPELVYFINANGLYVSVTNLLAPVTSLIAQLGPTIEGLGLELPEGLALGEIDSADDLVNMVLDMLKANGTLPFDISFDSGKLNIVGILDLVKQITAVAADGETPAINGLDINSSVIFTTTDEATGETITVPNIFATLALGIVEQYQSLANDKIYYKMYASDAEDYTLHNVDLLAIIIGAALDTFNNDDNEGILRKWLTIDDNDYYAVIKSILNLEVESFDPYKYDWFYFDPAITDDTTNENDELVPGNWQTYFPEDGSKVPVKYNDNTSTYFAYKFGYLEYFKSWNGAPADGNLWTAELANYLNTHFTELIDTVVSAIEIDGTKYDSAKELISTLWGNLNLYSKKNVYAVGKAVGKLLGGIDGVAKDVLGLVLGIDIGDFTEYMIHEVTADEAKVGQNVLDEDGNPVTYKKADGTEVNVTYIADATIGRTAFINAIANIVKPASFLLDWLLAGKSIEFMYLKDGNAAISLPGANGFDTALVPIIEAFGCDLTDAATYFDTEPGGRNGLNMFRYVANKLLGKIDTIAASEDPVNGILALIPNLLYFINANGLGVSVKNLLEPAALLVASLKETLSALPFDLPEGINEIEHVDDLVTLVLDALKVDFKFSLDKLDLTGIFDLVKALTAKAATDTEPARKGLDINGSVTYTYTDPETGLTTFDNGNIFETLALGIVERYTSGANGKTYFKMYLSEAKDGTLNTIDLIAIIVSAALDVFKNTDNKDFLEPLLNNLKDGLYDTVLNILNVTVNFHAVDFDWFYFNRNVDADDFTDANGHKIVVDYNDRSREYYIETYTYLRYLKEDTGNLWNARTAAYIESHFYDLADTIITAVTKGKDKEFTSMSDFIADAWSNANLFTKKNLYTVGALLGGFISGLDDMYTELIGLVLGVDLSAWDEYVNNKIADDEHPAGTPIYDENNEQIGEYIADAPMTYNAFIDELVNMLKPAGILLDWLLAGKSIFFMYDKEGQPAVNLAGAYGFDVALVPILEALGCEMEGYTDLVDHRDAETGNPVYKPVASDTTIGVELLKFAAMAILDKINAIATGGHALQDVVAMLPELIYFINANGLGTCLTNLVSPAIPLVEIAASFMGGEASGSEGDEPLSDDEKIFKALSDVVNDLLAKFIPDKNITVDLAKLNITGIFDILGGAFDLNINDAVTNNVGWNVYKTLALGVVSQYVSANTDTYYRMDLEPKQYVDGNLTVAPLAPIDMFAILIGSVVDVFKYADNEATLRSLLGDYYDLIDTILKLSVDVSYADYDWFYFDDDFGDAIKPGDAEHGGTWETFFPEVGSKVKVSYKNDKTVHQYFAYKYGYLEYLDPANAENGNFWNKNTAAYIENNFYTLVDTIVKNIEIDGTKYDSASALLSHLWDGVNLYTEKNVWAVGSMIGKLIQGLDETVQEVLGVVLGVDAADWNKYIEGKEGYVEPSETPLEREDFLNELVEILEPADFLLSWLLVGETHPFQLLFDKEGEPAIAIKGGNGFKEAIVPILEALGCSITAEEVAAANTGIKALRLTADKLLGRVDDIAASEDAVREIVGMIPELVYFINSNGLGTTVKNLLAPVAGLIEKVLPILPADLLGDTQISNIDDLIGFVLAKIKESNPDFKLEHLSLDNLDMVGIFDIVGQLLGLHINEAVAWDDPDTAENDNINIFSTLALGYVERYLSANGHDDFFKSYVTGEDDDTLGNVDLLAIIISAALDVFKDGSNAEFLSTNLDKIKEGLYDTIMEVLNFSMDLSYADYDWFYFDDTMGDAITPANWQTTFPADGDAYRVPYEVGTMYRFGYLEYRRYTNTDPENHNIWNQTSAAFIKDNFYDLVDTIITIATKDKGDYTSFSAFLSDKWSGLNLYSRKNVYAVGKLVGEAIQGLDDTVKEILGIVLGVDVSYWNEYVNNTTYTDENPGVYTGATARTDFINDLVKVFEPAELLLNWLLTGEDKPLTFFYDKNGEPAVSIKGGNGFKMAIVPILEALGCSITAAEVNAANTGIKAVKLTVEKLLAKIDGIAASDDALREIVALVPELVYFINANGLGTTVKRLVTPVAGLLEKMGSLISSDLNTVDDLIAFVLEKIPNSPITSLSLDALDIVGIFDIVKQILGIDINKAVTYVHGSTYENIYATLALGEVVRFASANGETAFRMHAVDDETTLATIDMIAILAATVVNVFTLEDADHVAALKKLVKDESIYDTIKMVLTLEKDNKYAEFQWLFTYKDSNAVPQIDPNYQGQYVSPLDRISSITGTAGYDRYWTKEMAQYVADNLVKVVNNVLLLIGISIPGIDGTIESIDDLINGLLPGGSIYTNELMGKIVSAIVGTGEAKEDGSVDKGLIGKLDEIDPDGLIRDLLKVSLKIDLSTLDAYRGRTNFGFTDGDRTGFTNAIAQFLSPVYPVLKWLLTDEDISLFYNVDKSDLIKLPGGKGYEQAIIPIMEAILPTNARVKTLAQYKADIAANQNAMLTDILDPLFDFVEDVLADPLNTLLARIPAIVYFINSKGIDTAVKNLIHPAYAILNALKALVDIDIDETIKGLIGFSLEELDFEALIEVVLNLLPAGLSSMKPLIVDAVSEFTIGTVVKKPSKAVYVSEKNVPYYHFFTMELASSSSASGSGSVIGSQNATLADLITILLRAVLKWITLPENQPTVVKFLSENIENEAVRTYVLNAYGADPNTYQTIDTGLIGFLNQPYGISEMMALLYYVYFAVNLGSTEAINTVSKYGNYWPYAVRAITVAMGNGVVDLSFLSGFVSYMNGLVERVNGQNGGNEGGNGSGSGYTPTDENTDGGHGSIDNVIDDINSGKVDPSQSTSLNFFQRLIKWFQDLFAKIGKLFGR